VTLYKLASDTGHPVHGGTGKWPLPHGAKPGAWRKITGKLVPCQNGLHVLRPTDISSWLRPSTLWEVEVGAEVIDHGDKLVVREARLVRKAAVLDDTVLRLLACDFAEHVLPIFEKKRPGDMRPREAVAAARAYASGEIKFGELREKRAAAYAYGAYARSKERLWQAERLVTVLGLGDKAEAPR
jgi:hypothetical protein